MDERCGSVRAGCSFYETHYEKTQPWLIIEAKRMHNLSEKTKITLMPRLINKGYFIDSGTAIRDRIMAEIFLSCGCRTVS